MAKKNFTAFLAGRDSFGHPLQLVYKGSKTHNSTLGGILSLFIYVLTFMMLIRAFKELILMEDPTTINQAKPLTLEDKAHIIPLNFEDYKYVIAFQITTLNYGSGMFTSLEIPPEVGGLEAYKTDTTLL